MTEAAKNDQGNAKRITALEKQSKYVATKADLELEIGLLRRDFQTIKADLYKARLIQAGVQIALTLAGVAMILWIMLPAG